MEKLEAIRSKNGNGANYHMELQRFRNIIENANQVALDAADNIADWTP